VDSSQHQRPKPNPEVFQVAMRQLGVNPGDCWIIEDSVNGLHAAKAAGCFAVALTTTFDRATVSAAGADAVVVSFAQLRGIWSRCKKGQRRSESSFARRTAEGGCPHIPRRSHSYFP